MEENRVELAENKLILGQSYSTLLPFPTPQSKRTLRLLNLKVWRELLWFFFLKILDKLVFLCVCVGGGGYINQKMGTPKLLFLINCIQELLYLS